MDYVFLGWSKNNLSNTVEYNAGDTYTANEDVTLYAIWKPTPLKFTYSDATSGNNTPSLSADSTELYSHNSLSINVEIPKGGYTVNASVGGGTVKFISDSGTTTTIISSTGGSIENYNITESGKITMSSNAKITVTITNTGEQVTFKLAE